jgi:L-2-hydroxyglutarate oxidase LhgO
MEIFTISVKINILVQVDAHIDTFAKLASQLRLPVFMLNTTVKSCEETERSYIQCGPFSMQRKSLKCSSLEKLESALAAWFKPTQKGNASIDGSPLKKKASHITDHLAIAANFLASSGWIDRF